MIKQSIKYFSHLLLFWMSFFTLDRILFILYNLNGLEISVIKKIEPLRNRSISPPPHNEIKNTTHKYDITFKNDIDKDALQGLVLSVM